MKDLAAHLLDGNLRSLSMLRDGYYGPAPGDDLSSYAGLLTCLNQLSAEWVVAARCLSPNVLIELLAQSGREHTELLTTLTLGRQLPLR